VRTDAVILRMVIGEIDKTLTINFSMEMIIASLVT